MLAKKELYPCAKFATPPSAKGLKYPAFTLSFIILEVTTTCVALQVTKYTSFVFKWQCLLALGILHVHCSVWLYRRIDGFEGLFRTLEELKDIYVLFS